MDGPKVQLILFSVETLSWREAQHSYTTTLREREREREREKKRGKV